MEKRVNIFRTIYSYVGRIDYGNTTEVVASDGKETVERVIADDGKETVERVIAERLEQLA